PSAAGLDVAAWAGAPLRGDELSAVSPSGGEVRSRAVPPSGADGTVALALGVAGRPVGILAVAGVVPGAHGLELLRTFANHAALAIEREQLRSRAERSERLEQADRWRRAMLGAVSHDLRTPLATVKAAVSDLRSDDVSLCREDEQELLGLVEAQADRLERLVA
ncbi:turgor pressure sensor, partial [mine drainage metagenome]